MANRELKDRKLSNHQKPIWRKTFEASILHTSIEAAEKKAWQAVDIWERVGAFNESQTTQPVDQSDSPIPVLETYRQAWELLATRVGSCAEGSNDWEAKLEESMHDFAIGKIGINDFKEDLEEIFPESCD